MVKRFYRSHELNTTAEGLEGQEFSEVKPEDGSFVKYLKRTSPRGFDGHNLFDVGKYFWRSLFRENLNVRATSLSFNFFLALFPTLIFLLTFISFMPSAGIKTRLIYELKLLLPSETFKAVSTTIYEILNHHNSGLLSFGFLLAVWFASNAFHTLISGFNRRLTMAKKSNWVKNRMKAIALTCMVSSLVIFALIVLTWVVQANVYMVRHEWGSRKTFQFIFSIVEIIMLSGLIFFVISIIYYFAPSTKLRWRFVSPGSIVSSALCLLATFTFSVYVNNFNAYNKVYGSIGAIIALMVLIYINTLFVIVGFELNLAIEKAKMDSGFIREKRMEQQRKAEAKKARP